MRRVVDGCSAYTLRRSEILLTTDCWIQSQAVTAAAARNSHNGCVFLLHVFAQPLRGDSSSGPAHARFDLWRRRVLHKHIYSIAWGCLLIQE